jgi:hypothetical protein
LTSPVQLGLPWTFDLASVFKEAHQRLRPRTPLPDIRVEYFAFAGLNHTARFFDNRLLIRVSDIFVDAPREVMASLALILLAKLYRKKTDRAHHDSYRAFILRSEIQERARAARSSRGRAPRQIAARGTCVDLDACFDRLNGQYFGGELDKPRISWSAKRSRHILGRYDATHHMIFISRLFDSRNIPPYVLDYIMFHEMLHVKHRSRIHDCRVLVHTPEFRSDERSFAEYRAAKQWLQNL